MHDEPPKGRRRNPDRPGTPRHRAAGHGRFRFPSSQSVSDSSRCEPVVPTYAGPSARSPQRRNILAVGARFVSIFDRRWRTMLRPRTRSDRLPWASQDGVGRGTRTPDTSYRHGSWNWCPGPHGFCSAWHTVSCNATRAPGSVKIRTGGDSPRPGRCHRPVDPVKFRDRRLKSGWEVARRRRTVPGG